MKIGADELLAENCQLRIEALLLRGLLACAVEEYRAFGVVTDETAKAADQAIRGRLVEQRPLGNPERSARTPKEAAP